MKTYSAGTPSAWIPVALSEAVAPRGVMRVVYEGRDFVVWRDHETSVHCFDNRCPHRGMRLSFGFVRGNRLTCLYHGWQYSGDGACRYIPAHPELAPPETLCTDVYPCQEFDGLVWFSPGGRPDDIAVSFGGANIRSLSVNCNPVDLRAFVAAVRLPSLGGGQDGFDARVLHDDAQRLVLSPRQTGAPLEQVIVAIQPVADDRTMLHVQARPALDASAKKTVSRWLEHLRRRIESQRGEDGAGSRSARREATPA